MLLHATYQANTGPRLYQCSDGKTVNQDIDVKTIQGKYNNFKGQLKTWPQRVVPGGILLVWFHCPCCLQVSSRVGQQFQIFRNKFLHPSAFPTCPHKNVDWYTKVRILPQYLFQCHACCWASSIKSDDVKFTAEDCLDWTSAS